MPSPTLLDKLLDAPDLKLLVEKAENRLSEEAFFDRDACSVALKALLTK